MFVVYGDEKARLQFFRDIVRQKATKEKIMGLNILPGKFERMTTYSRFYNNQDTKSTEFWEKIYRSPEDFNTYQSEIWRHVMQSYGRNQTSSYYLALTPQMHSYASGDFIATIVSNTQTGRYNQMFLNSFLDEEVIQNFIHTVLTQKHIFGEHNMKPIFVKCEDQGDTYSYFIDVETFSDRIQISNPWSKVPLQDRYFEHSYEKGAI